MARSVKQDYNVFRQQLPVRESFMRRKVQQKDTQSGIFMVFHDILLALMSRLRK